MTFPPTPRCRGIVAFSLALLAWTPPLPAAEPATDTLAFANGGVNTVPGDRQIATRDKVRFEGNGREGGLLCVGSSYAWHGPAPDKLGWHGDWGMAASAREKDCAHVLWDAVRKVRPEAPLCIVQSAFWERHYTGDVELLERQYAAAKGFRPDWICIITTVANAPRSLVDAEPVDAHYAKMVDWFRATNPAAKIVLSVGSSGPVAGKAIRAFAAARGYPVVDFNSFLDQPGMRATGLFAHAGVASHPSDKGMAEMGRRYAAALGLPGGGLTLPNGLVLPADWPPRIDPRDRNPMRAPYLEAANIPKAIPIDLGRQLFVDDYLVESTSGVTRAFHKPVKYAGNPVMWPQTKAELAASAPGCAMSGGGVWWDPTRRRFRMWYMSGFAGRISYAESPDGLRWERPPVGPNGDNVVLPQQMSDTFSVWPGYDTDAPYDNWRISISPGGNPTRSAAYVSPDGLRWRFLRETGVHYDCTTMFYDPFVGKWVWSLRAGWRARSRIYHAHPDFRAGCDWHFPAGRGASSTNTADCALWLACDNADLPRVLGGRTYTNAQLYNVDAVPYESIMVGLFKILCGHDNDEAAKAGMPKTTSIHFAYSRDGFHFTRPDRTPAIDESGWGSGAWDSGYVGNISSCFAIKDERLWFYYVGARGDATRNNPPQCVYPNGMHWNFSVGVATLRRDGFAGMVADGRGTLTTRPLLFSGAHLFVNADARFGEVAAEVLDETGAPYPGYAAADCRAAARVDSTKQAVTWAGGDLARFAGRPVRLRFRLHTATLFSFWVSKRPTGESGGYVAAGGPGYKGLRDE